METKQKTRVFEISKDGEINLYGKAFMPTVKDIEKGAFNDRPIRAMVLDYSPQSNMISGLTDPYIMPGNIINYIDQDESSIKIQIEYISFGVLNNVPKGCLVQFSIYK
ncbi:hypothetical protein PL373_13500 [Tenacibaculum maritimum]|nr:hypothetical protein [Tenacibaculum maritimum]MDB0602145.1 hypothetical protein [Tenacibaculum maritimum]MDB0613820.1 hypothetical protein [Tenacibaculum maritimum]